MPTAKTRAKKAEEKAVFTTPWFKLIEKRQAAGAAPYYAIRTLDYVSVVALTADKEFVLVRQFRPAVNRVTLELPAGHVELNQTPEEAAKSEIIEETGCRVQRVEFLGKLAADTGRLENTLWCYGALVSRPETKRAEAPEPGLEVVTYKGSLASLLRQKDFCCAPNVAALMLAVHKGFLSL